MFREFKNLILDFVLKLVFWKKVYFYAHNKSDIMVYLVIPFKGRLVLLESDNQYSMANTLVDIEDKSKVIDALRDVLSEKIIKDISYIRNVDIIDFYREIISEKRTKTIKDCLFFRVDLAENFKESELLEGAKLVDIDSLKVECFKNRFNLYDYRLLIRSVINSSYEEGLE